MADRTPCPTANFALVIAQRKSDGRFLVVKESRNRGWWIPGGRVEHGESFARAAVRETKEEAGIDVALEGVLRVEHSPGKQGARLRVVFFARPRDEAQAAKTTPDDESDEARWMTLREFTHLIETQREKLRASEPYEWFNYIERGGRVHDLAVLASEHDPVAAGAAPAAAGGAK